MAAITGNQVKLEWASGDAARVAVFAVRNVTTGDTFDVGVSAAGQFLAVKQAVMIGATVIGSATATFTGTVITMPAGLSSDSAYIMVHGDSAV